MNHVQIQPLGDAHLVAALDVIRRAFGTVADDLGLTADNCPSHPIFTTADTLRAKIAAGMAPYGAFQQDRLVGFVGIKRHNGDTWEMERLAVLPEHRHLGIGRQLAQFVEQQALEQQATRVTIGVIEENAVLKQWYQQIGYVQTDQKRFPGLPFTVCFMEKALSR